MKKYVIYFVSIVLLSIALALMIKCATTSSFDSLTNNIALIIQTKFNLKYEVYQINNIVLTCFNLLFVLLYALLFKKKDFYMAIIYTLILTGLLQLFGLILSNITINQLWVRILIFLFSINLLSLSVALSVIYSITPSPYECLTLIVKDKIFKKKSYGFSKVIIEASLITISVLIIVIFVRNDVYLLEPSRKILDLKRLEIGYITVFTFVIMAFQGPLIDLYLKLLKKIKFFQIDENKKEASNEEQMDDNCTSNKSIESE